MKTLLVLAEHPDFAEAIRAGVNPEHYRILHRTALDDAEPLLAHGLAEACIVDLELTSVQGLWFLEKLRRKNPKCPVLVFTGAKQSEWEEEAYLQGATHVLNKPVRPRMLTALLDRLWATPAAPLPAPAAAPPPPKETPRSPESISPGTVQTLGVLRDFSGILTHSLNAEGILKQFLLLLREILSVNRGVIFLRQPFAAFGSASGMGEGRRLRAASAIGLSPALLQHFELSFEAGIGGHIFRLGRILRRFSDEARTDVETQKEFELLGAQVAVPILDRETVLGVALFDGRITGEPLVNSELELIFHLLEQLGLAIKNIWLHDQLAGNHQMMVDIMRELTSACVVVNCDLVVLHANKMARRCFARPGRRGEDLEFSDLPQLLGAKVYQVLKTGAAISNFRYEPEDAPGTVFNINLVPFHRLPGGLPASALLMAEDLTQSEQLQRLQTEAANLRLIRNMADRLTAEIGNAILPIDTHQQLLAQNRKNWSDAEFKSSFEVALAFGCRRIIRSCDTLRALAANTLGADKTVLQPLIEASFQEARKHVGKVSCPPQYDVGNKPVVISGNPAALKLALTEVMLNALQANPADTAVKVHLQVDPGKNGHREVQIEIQDDNGGFTPEAFKKAFEPFFTTRAVGLGLGLTVCRKIIEDHHGKVEVLPPQSGQGGSIRITLPLDASIALPA